MAASSKKIDYSNLDKENLLAILSEIVQRAVVLQVVVSESETISVDPDHFR